MSMGPIGPLYTVLLYKDSFRFAGRQAQQLGRERTPALTVSGNLVVVANVG